MPQGLPGHADATRVRRDFRGASSCQAGPRPRPAARQDCRDRASLCPDRPTTRSWTVTAHSERPGGRIRRRGHAHPEHPGNVRRAGLQIARGVKLRPGRRASGTPRGTSAARPTRTRIAPRHIRGRGDGHPHRPGGHNRSPGDARADRPGDHNPGPGDAHPDRPGQTAVQPFNPSLTIRGHMPCRSMRSWESVRRGKGRRRAVPGSHGPFVERV
jgi:hypothetical protein